jgi:outer membrane protein TolC
VISAGFTELAAHANIDVVRGQLLPQMSITGDLNRSVSGSNVAANSIEMIGSAHAERYGAAL